MGELIAEVLLAFLEPIFEAVMDGVVGSAHYLIPGKKLSRKAKRIIAYVICFLGLAMLISLISGVIFLVDNKGESVAGWIMVSVAVAYFLVLILLRIVAVVYKRAQTKKQNKVNKKTGD